MDSQNYSSNVSFAECLYLRYHNGGIEWRYFLGNIILNKYAFEALSHFFLGPAWWDAIIKPHSREEAEKARAPHSSALAWKIPWTEEPGRLQSMGSLRVGHN